MDTATVTESEMGKTNSKQYTLDGKERRYHITRKDVSEEVKSNREKSLSMPLDEKRKLYKKKKFVVLDQIETWHQQAPDIMRKWARQKFEPLKDVDGSLNNKISMWQGDITTLEIDAIVNAANSSLLGGGGVDGAIHSAAGYKLREECATINPCDTGDAKITAGYKLPAKYVIHTVGPMGINPKMLASCYKRCLEIVTQEKIRTVAFPCISTGIYGYDIDKATPVVMTTVRNWLTANHEHVDRILFCVFLSKDIDVYEENLLRYFPIVKDGERPGPAVKKPKKESKPGKEESKTDDKEPVQDGKIESKAKDKKLETKAKDKIEINSKDSVPDAAEKEANMEEHGREFTGKDKPIKDSSLNVKDKKESKIESKAEDSEESASKNETGKEKLSVKLTERGKPEKVSSPAKPVTRSEVKEKKQMTMDSFVTKPKKTKAEENVNSEDIVGKKDDENCIDSEVKVADSAKL